jgi:selT/selW/selH-like putative selenoprotein
VGSGGVFEVLIDDELAFSKKRDGRFPEHDAVVAEVGSRLR